MANEVKVLDSFTDLGADVDINGRFPPVNDGGYAWWREGGTGRWARGDGAGSVKFASVITTIKIQSIHGQCAVRAVWNRGTENNGVVLLIGDSGFTAPRYGYGAAFDFATNTLQFGRYDNYAWTALGSSISISLNVTEDNTLVFQRLDATTLGAIVNGVSAGTVQDSTYSLARYIHGLQPYPQVDQTARLREFAILDSVTAGAEPPPVDIDPDLYAHYSLDSADLQWATVGAEVRDKSPNNRHMAKSGGMTAGTNAIPGQLNEALLFRRTSSDYAYRVASADFNAVNFTITFWAKHTAGTAMGNPFTLMREWDTWISFEIDGTHLSAPVAATGQAEVEPTSTAVDFTDTWHHVGLTVTATEARLFSDGIFRAAASFSSPSGIMVRRLYLANWHHTDTGWFSGGLDDVRIYQRILTDQEIASMVTAPPPVVYDIVESW